MTPNRLDPYALARLFAMLLALVAVDADAQSRTVFSGVPSVKVSEAGLDRVVEALPRAKAVNLGCAISEIGGKYYWATRESKEMTRYVSGTFITYSAIDGSGYVRVIAAGAKPPASLMSDTEAKFDYVEHLMIGLRSVTYYGTSQ